LPRKWLTIKSKIETGFGRSAVKYGTDEINNQHTAGATLHNRPVSAGQEENMENCLWYVPLGCMGGEWIGVNSADEARNYLCRRVKDFSMSSDPVSDLVAINQVTGEKVTVTLEEAI